VCCFSRPNPSNEYLHLSFYLPTQRKNFFFEKQKGMNKTIFIVWLQGFSKAPDIVQRCVESWKYHHPTHSGWNIVLLNLENLYEYITLEPVFLTLESQEITNVIRMKLLCQYGGVWADATTFCNQCLEDWILPYTQQGFFAFEKPGPDRLLSNWFLYAEKNNYLIEQWCCATLDFHRTNTQSHPYFIHHYLFGRLYDTDPRCKAMWDAVPKRSANGMGPHYLQEKGFFMKDPTVRQHIDSQQTPLYKLSYKGHFLPFDADLNLYYLYSKVPSRFTSLGAEADASHDHA